MRAPALLLALLLSLATLLASALPQRASAGEIIGALSQNRVSLTANFSGTEILIFGAVRQDADDFANHASFDIVITVEGPRQPVAIWRKARRFGIWINEDVVSMASVPSFYAVATTDPLHEIITPETDAQYRISLREALRPNQAVGDFDAEETEVFTQALMRLRQEGGQYVALERWVSIERDILFRANVRLPANLTEGAYTTRMYLVRGGEIEHQYRTAIFVRKEGLERWLSQMAYDEPLLYGLLALLIALVAGWGASEAMRLVRR